MASLTRAEAQAMLDDAVGKAMANADEPLDTIWMLLAAMLVFFMHLGFAYLETGTVRAKNVQTILLKNLLDTCVGFLMWYFLGYGLAFGNSGSKFIGTGPFLTSGFEGTAFRVWIFQGAFCATAATIVSGAVAERMQLIGFILYTMLLTGFMYPIVIHWGWSGNGFLAYTDADDQSVSVVGPAFKDFAGSGMVHLVGAVGAFWGAVVLGPRKGRFDPECEAEFKPHSVPMIVLGTFVLWLGWYGFNGGSTLSMHDADTAVLSALVLVNTTMAAASGGIITFLIKLKMKKKHDVCAFCNGILGGCVSVTAACGFVEPGESFIIGAIGGIVYVTSSMTLQKYHIDDPLDAVPAHGFCGIWGVIAAGLFGDKESGGNGAFYGGDQFGVQLLGVVVIIGFVSALSIPALFGLKRANLLRISDEKELRGGDAMAHSPKFAYRH